MGRTKSPSVAWVTDMVSINWWRTKGNLSTYVHGYGIYSIRKFGRGVSRVYLNQDGTTYYGTEAECMKAVLRVVNSMEMARAQANAQKSR